MDLKLSEICAMLGERIEEYNSVSRKRKISRDRVMQAKIRKIQSDKEYENIFSHKCISTSTPINTAKPSEKQQPPASFSSATKTIEETPKRSVLRVHRKIILNPRHLTFDSGEFYEINCISDVKD